MTATIPMTDASNPSNTTAAIARSLIRPAFTDAVRSIGDGPLTDAALRAHIDPLFSRVLSRLDRTGMIYLANHSLGRPLDATADDIQAAVDAWYDEIDGAWSHWLSEIQAYRTLMAALIGCKRADAVVPKTNAGQGLRAVLNAFPVETARRGLNVVSTTGEFDSCDFILKSYATRGRITLTSVPARNDCCVYAEDVIAAITPGTDLVMVSQVYFVTGQEIDALERIAHAAHKRNALVLVDTYHGAGVLPMSFDELGADFAIGGNYKYTRGGPGTCWLAIAERHLRPGGCSHTDTDMRPIDTGWFAKVNTFAYERPSEPRLAHGGDAWLESTPPVLTGPQARAGLEFTLAMGVDRLRAHNLDQQRRLCERLVAHGATPWRPQGFKHGAFVCVPSTDIHSTARWLKEHGLNIDARPWPGVQQSTGGRIPAATTAGVVRLCPDVLTTDDELTSAARLVGQCPGLG